MRKAFPLLLLALVFTGCTLVPDVSYRADVVGEQPGWTGDDFIRYNGYDNVAGTMQVSATDYTTADGKHTITLVGAVHIGDAAYYAEIQGLLDKSDRVYYELVKPADMPYPTPGIEEADGMYSGMADLFGLSEQMREVDYDREHFVWLDMSQEEFSARLSAIVTKAASRLAELFGQGGQEEPIRAFGQALRLASPELRAAFARALLHAPIAAKAAPTDPIAMLMELIYLPLSLEKAYYRETKGEKAFEDKYKHNMNVGLQDPEQAIQQMEELGRDGLTDILMDALEEFQGVILEERNQVVIDGLLADLESGDMPAHVTVFYGAAHNPGIAAGLREAGLVRGRKVHWMNAIDIQP